MSNDDAEVYALMNPTAKVKEIPMVTLDLKGLHSAQLASLMADCILRGKEIGPDVAKLRARHLEMGYCFNDEQFETALEKLAAKAGL